MKKTALLLALACAILTAPAIFAQTPAADAPPENGAAHGQRMIQHRLAYMTTVLSLTTAQQTQVKSVLTAAVANGSTTHGSMKTAHDNLKTAIHANDPAGMEQAASTIGNLMAQEELARAKTEAAIYQLLTPEQQTKMTALESEEHHGGPGRGPGGPGL
jgi:periplasmic protein CpxP/Spy